MRLQRFQYGSVTVINDAYNANPASMAAGLRTLADTPVAGTARRVAILADMLELGTHAKALHEQIGQLSPVGRHRLPGSRRPLRQYLADAATMLYSGAAGGSGAPADHGADTAPLSCSGATGGSRTLAVHRFADADQAAKGIHKCLRTGDIALLKGSRGMHLEKLLPSIQQAFGPPPAPSPMGAK